MNKKSGIDDKLEEFKKKLNLAIKNCETVKDISKKIETLEVCDMKTREGLNNLNEKYESDWIDFQIDPCIGLHYGIAEDVIRHLNR